jgi:hypothetical protein
LKPNGLFFVEQRKEKLLEFRITFVISARALDAPDELVATVDGLFEGDEVPVDAGVARVRRTGEQVLLVGAVGGLLPVVSQAAGVVPLVAFGHLALEHVALRVLEADKARHLLLPAETAHK